MTRLEAEEQIVTRLFLKIWNELNGDKFTEIFGDDGNRLADKFFYYYDRDFLRFWLYLSTEQKIELMKKL